MSRLLALFVLTTGCAGVEDAFFVRRDRADLPVWLQGDPDADTLIVMQHGSGATGKIYDWMPAYDALEARYAVVYWDQRGAGHSQGQAAAEDLRLDTSVEDLDLVLDVVRDRYAPERLVLMGHSLGGGLSLAYLRDPERAAGIDGYVDLCGGRTLPGSYDVVRDTLLTFADAEGDAEMAAFYADRPDFPRDEPDRSRHGAYVDATLLARGYDQPASTAAMQAFLTRRGLTDTLLGSFDALAYGTNTARFVETFDLDGVDLSRDDVASIPAPALVLAGRFDYAVPVEITEGTFEAFAEALPPSRHVVLEQSGHFPMWDEPERFEEAVVEFVEALP